MLAIRLPDAMKRRLAAPAAETGRTETALAREASLVYRVEFDPDALKDLKELDRPVQQRLVGFLGTRVGTLAHPRDIGEALTGATLGNHWTCRVGDWRIICDIQDARIVVRVLRLGNRRDSC